MGEPGTRRPRHPFLDHPAPIPLAHRGGDLAGPENSLAAFQAAVDLGYRYLETDLHATVDGVLVAFHDATLDRVTDHRGRIAERSWAEISRVRVGGREPIPRFDELLASFPDVRWNVDVKDDGVLGPLLARLDDDLLQRVCVGSFSDTRLQVVRTVLGERACTSAGPREVRRLRAWSLAGPLASLATVRADCVQIPPRHGRIPLVDPPMLAAAHRLALPVHVWTVNDAAMMRRLLDAGIDGIFTDALHTLRSVLEERGQWHAAGPGPRIP